MLALEASLSEAQFCAAVGQLKADASKRAVLAELLRENNPVYDERGTAAVVRMRGWILLAIAELGLTEPELLYVLEELDNGHDAYLVAAAARALRTYATPAPVFAQLLLRALGNMRSRDDVVSLTTYGGYTIVEGSTARQEILRTFAWLGAAAREALPELEAMRGEAGFSAALKQELGLAIGAIGAACAEGAEPHDCCSPQADAWKPAPGAAPLNMQTVTLEDQDGRRIGFRELFTGKSSVVAFFYTRCTNPRKCSLTIEKLARVQRLLREKGFGDRIQTAAITYDPAFDLPDRLRAYGASRGLTMDDNNRMLRTVRGMAALRGYFQLGVNFIESVVNRHRIEVHVLNPRGEIAASFERIEWDEAAVVDTAIAAQQTGTA